MIKFLFLLFLVITLSGIVALRFRRQILILVEAWEKLKNPKTGQKKSHQINNTENANSIPLIKCSKCTIWIPQNKAVGFNSKIYFCSEDCMKKVSEIN